MLNKFRIGVLLLLIGGSAFIITVQSKNSLFTAQTSCVDMLPCTCPDGNGGACMSGQCMCLGTCGDGTVNNGEECDDGNKIAGDGCRCVVG